MKKKCDHGPLIVKTVNPLNVTVGNMDQVPMLMENYGIERVKAKA